MEWLDFVKKKKHFTEIYTIDLCTTFSFGIDSKNISSNAILSNPPYQSNKLINKALISDQNISVVTSTIFCRVIKEHQRNDFVISSFRY